MLHQREECQDFKRFQCDFCLKWFKRRSHLNLCLPRKYNLRGQDSATPSSSKQLDPADKESPSACEIKSENEEPSTAAQQSPNNNNSNNISNNNGKKPLVNNADALIALQQLASISTARSLQHLVPHLPQNLHIDTSSLVAGRKLPRQSSKRMPPYESNRCPLCARVYRSQAFLNEHMRKEHSVLI
ncbi:hypothetical protein ACLKA6_002929 [Drosophila palustris]